MNKPYLAGNGSLWIQPDGANSKPFYLGTHDVAEIVRGLGGTTMAFAPNPAEKNSFDAVAIYRNAAPEPISTSITTSVSALADWLDAVKCPVVLYILFTSCGRRDVFFNWERAFILEDVYITQDTLSQSVIRTPADQNEVTQTFEIQARLMHKLYRSGVNEQNTIAGTGRVALTLGFEGGRQCAGGCGNPRLACEVGYFGLAGILGMPNLYYTLNAGIDWQPTATTPFSTWEDVSGVIALPNSPGTWRAVAARGTTDGLNPAEIAYSDDRGATWTNVNAGSVNGQYAIGRGYPLYAVNDRHLWFVTTGGYIYFSADMGATWTAQESAAVQDLHAIHFTNERHGLAVGAANKLLKTTNGVAWITVTGPAAEVGITAQTCFMVDEDHWWVGYADARLWYTNDAGSTWFERSFPGSGSGQIQGISFASRLSGEMIHISAGGATGNLFKTIDGGFAWETIALPSGTAALYAIQMCDCNTAYIAGDF